MERTQFYAGIISMGLAGLLWIMDLTKMETSFGETFLAKVSIYPAAFFGLLAMVLIFSSLKPLLWVDHKEIRINERGRGLWEGLPRGHGGKDDENCNPS